MSPWSRLGPLPLCLLRWTWPGSQSMRGLGFLLPCASPSGSLSNSPCLCCLQKTCECCTLPFYWLPPNSLRLRHSVVSVTRHGLHWQAPNLSLASAFITPSLLFTFFFKEQTVSACLTKVRLRFAPTPKNHSSISPNKSLPLSQREIINIFTSSCKTIGICY